MPPAEVWRRLVSIERRDVVQAEESAGEDVLRPPQRHVAVTTS